MIHNKADNVRLWIAGSITRTRTPVGRRQFARIIAISLIAAWPGTYLQAQDDVYSAARVKAAFLYHFATYVSWPDAGETDEFDETDVSGVSGESDASGEAEEPGASGAAEDEFTIAVFDADEVAAELEQFLPGHTIQGRPMNVRRLQAVADLNGAEVLFIGADANAELNEQLALVVGRPVLVVTDVPQGLRKGAMINFRVVDSHVRFEISQPAAESAGLELSSRLLAAAMFVDTTGAIVNISATVVATNRFNAAGR